METVEDILIDIKRGNPKDENGRAIPPEEILNTMIKNKAFEDKCRIEVVSRDGVTRLLINGTDISDSATNFSFSQNAGEIPVLHIDMNAFNLSIDSDCTDVVIGPSGNEMIVEGIRQGVEQAIRDSRQSHSPRRDKLEESQGNSAG